MHYLISFVIYLPGMAVSIYRMGSGKLCAISNQSL